MSGLFLSDLLNKTKKEMVGSLRGIRERTKAKLPKIESNLRAQHLLATEGLDLCVSEWCPDATTLELPKAKDLLKVRRALNCEMKVTGDKSPVGKSRKKIWVGVRAAGFPGLTIRYQAPLPKGSKCKIVSSKQRGWTSRSVVCEV